MNLQWGSGVPVRELLRYHGYDPQLMATAEGIWSSRAHMVNSERFFGKWGPPHSTHAWAHKAFQYDPRVAAYREQAFALARGERMRSGPGG